MADTPPLFSPYSFEAAREVARNATRLLVVDVMAQWCGPCREMDRTTWRDPGLEEWVRENAIAIQVDADGDRRTAGALGVQAFPTVVAIRADGQTSRLVGYRTAEALMDWLLFVLTGETPSQRLLRTVDREHDLPGHLRLARALFEERHWPEATAEYLQLWESAAPAMAALKAGPLRRHLEQLVGTVPEAAKPFLIIRDRTGTLAESGDHPARLDWIVLNDVLGDTRRTFTWFEQVKTDPNMAPLFQACATRLVPFLIDRGLWDEIHLVYPDPAAELARAAAELEGETDPEAEAHPGEIRARRLAAFRSHAAILFGSLIAIKKEEPARVLREAILAVDDSKETRDALQRASHRAKWS